MAPPSSVRSCLPTTFRSIALAASLTLIAVGAGAEEPLAEAELVARYLDGPTVDADLDAWAARARAAGTVSVDVASPEIAYRHEDAAGPAGARTDAIGASLTVALGAALGARRASAAAASESALASREAALLDSVCALRFEAAGLWAAQQEASARRVAQDRLDELAAALGELARAGESSGYDGDRAVLAASTHRASLVEATGREVELRALLSRRVGAPVPAVSLGPMATLDPLDELVEQALGSHPGLVALRRMRDARDRQRSAVQASGAPDLTLSGGARFDAPPEGGPASPGFEVGVAVELPVTGRARVQVASASAELSEAEAELLRAEQRIGAAVEAAWSRAASVVEVPAPAVDPAAVWAAARDRYLGGEASIDELLQTANDVEEAELADLTLQVLERTARRDLDCAVGRFDDAALQSVLEEALR